MDLEHGLCIRDLIDGQMRCAGVARGDNFFLDPPFEDVPQSRVQTTHTS